VKKKLLYFSLSSFCRKIFVHAGKRREGVSPFKQEITFSAPAEEKQLCLPRVMIITLPLQRAVKARKCKFFIAAAGGIIYSENTACCVRTRAVISRRVFCL
jgi:hypothetical protein